MVKSVFNITEFTKSMLHNCIKVVRLKPDQPNQWLRACQLQHFRYHHNLCYHINCCLHMEMYVLLFHTMSLVDQATESKGDYFAKLKWFSITKITFLWRGLKFKRDHGPPGSPISAAYDSSNNHVTVDRTCYICP